MSAGTLGDAALQPASAFATSTQGTEADTALKPNSTADGTYPIYNDGTTSGQLTGITISGGLITTIP